MPVAAVVKVSRTETVAAAAPKKSILFLFEILKELRKVRNNHRIPHRSKQAMQNAATDAFRRKIEMLSQEREALLAQKSNFDPAQKRTILIAKAQKPPQKDILASDGK
jgi:hypothetical protein